MRSRCLFAAVLGQPALLPPAVISFPALAWGGVGRLLSRRRVSGDLQPIVPGPFAVRAARSVAMEGMRGKVMCLFSGFGPPRPCTAQGSCDSAQPRGGAPGFEGHLDMGRTWTCPGAGHHPRHQVHRSLRLLLWSGWRFRVVLGRAGPVRPHRGGGPRYSRGQPRELREGRVLFGHLALPAALPCTTPHSTAQHTAQHGCLLLHSTAPPSPAQLLYSTARHSSAQPCAAPAARHRPAQLRLRTAQLHVTRCAASRTSRPVDTRQGQLPNDAGRRTTLLSLGSAAPLLRAGHRL